MQDSDLKIISAHTGPPPGRAFRDSPPSWLTPAPSNLSTALCQQVLPPPLGSAFLFLVPTALCTTPSTSVQPLDKDAVRSASLSTSLSPLDKDAYHHLTTRVLRGQHSTLYKVQEIQEAPAASMFRLGV